MSWLVLALALAAGPGEWALPGVRVHVDASEELDPDRLRALARPEVVIWLRTRSNGLRRSTAETLRLAGSAFVQVRPPLGAPALAPFVGRVGPWVEERGLDVARVRRWSPGRLAVDVEGPFTEELARRLRMLRPIAVRWARGGWPDREEWTRAKAFSGLVITDAGPGPAECGAVPAHTRARVRIPLAAAPSDGICGLPLRIQVPATVDAADVQRVLLLQPSADVEAEVGEDVGRADAVRRLVEQLVSATPQGGAPAPRGAGADAGQR
ncbi:MAG TPA: hypothetical protein VFF12_14560 [Myxococcaceae bacterium]|nr:hypothetical protein [Myxococcaceae bacterium]